MVRIIDGIPINPVILILGWISAIVIIAVLIRFNPEFSTAELAEYATLGAYIFVLQSIVIPIKFFGVLLTLSGVPLVIMVKGVRRGLIIASSAIILNHLFIPGALSMLGLNLSNMLIAGLIAGLIPSFIYRKMGRRVRYLSGFIGGLVYFGVLIIAIIVELSFTIGDLEISEIDVVLRFLGIGIFIIGTLEGLLTAIGSSYYYRMKNKRIVKLDEGYTYENDELELIDFMEDPEE